MIEMKCDLKYSNKNRIAMTVCSEEEVQEE